MKNFSTAGTQFGKAKFRFEIALQKILKNSKMVRTSNFFQNPGAKNFWFGCDGSQLDWQRRTEKRGGFLHRRLAENLSC